MNADEIVKALRHCYQEDIQGCYGCPLNKHDLCYEANLELSAADLIESLQKQLNDMTDTARRNYCKFVRMSEERDELQNELAESQCRERAAVKDIMTAYNKGICEVCQYNEQLTAQCIIKNGGKCDFIWRGPQKGEPHETV